MQLQKQFSVYSKTKRTVVVQMFIVRGNKMRHFEYFGDYVWIIFMDENFELEVFHKRNVIILSIKPIAEPNPCKISIVLFYACVWPLRLKFSNCIFHR